MVLSFDDANRRMSFDVTIIEDELLEYTEDFDLELRFDPFLAQPPSGVVLCPNVSIINILDDDSKEIANQIHVPYHDYK